MNKKVVTIPATKKNFAPDVNGEKVRRRVAGYARVSTDSDEQFTSYEAQVRYYKDFIERNPDWQFVNVYADEGISGLSTKKREGFQLMISDALSGKIDLIITKSVSRFARNTVDTLTVIRELKAKGVEVYFEKENIYTFDGKGELLLTIMGSLAQEESRSISENVSWGHRRNFENGKVYMSYGSFMGYEKDENGQPVVNEEQAKVVRLIYKLFLEGVNISEICKTLEAKGIKAPRGGDRWHTTCIRSILTNEKYKGSALLQKSITVDYLTKTKKKNEGELPQYYIEHSHPAIIKPEIWAMVQKEFERREEMPTLHHGNHYLTCKVICAECGTMYGRKVFHSNDKFRYYAWRCENRYKGGCKSPTVREDYIELSFVKMYNRVKQNSQRVIEDLELVCDAIASPDELDAPIQEKLHEAEFIVAKLESLVARNSTEEYESLYVRYVRTKNDLESLKKQQEELQQKREMIRLFINNLKDSPDTLENWDGTLFSILIEKVLVHKDKSLTFVFYSGLEETI